MFYRTEYNTHMSAINIDIVTGTGIKGIKAALAHVHAEIVHVPSCERDSVHVLCKNINSICGFTRETLNATVTNIEGREFHRAFLSSRNLPPEHQRVCSTDNVECFFSVLRDNLGSDFTLKRVQYSWRRTCKEFSKRIEPSPSFYYFTSAHNKLQHAIFK